MELPADTIYGSECSYWLEERLAFCGAPAHWLEIEPSTAAPLNVLCRQHQSDGCVQIPASARRAAPSKYTAVATHKR